MVNNELLNHLNTDVHGNQTTIDCNGNVARRIHSGHPMHIIHR
jgi:hypothetical protein